MIELFFNPLAAEIRDYIKSHPDIDSEALDLLNSAMNELENFTADYITEDNQETY